MRLEIDITHKHRELRELLESRGFTLEGAVFDDECRPTMACVHRVHLGNLPGPTVNPPIVKFSKRDHAMTKAPSIQLSTPNAYRNQDDLPRGIQDPLDAAYVEKHTLDEFMNAYGNKKGKIRSLSGTVALTRAVSGLWVFCTSMLPPNRTAIGALAQRFPDYDAATVIADPSAFASQLGLDFGRLAQGEIVRLDPLVELARQLTNRPTMRIVNVDHGPVHYPRDLAGFLSRYPDELLPQVLPFVKRGDFEGDREYRFVVSVLGKPASETVRFPISPELRGLATPGQMGS